MLLKNKKDKKVSLNQYWSSFIGTVKEARSPSSSTKWITYRGKSVLLSSPITKQDKT